DCSLCQAERCRIARRLSAGRQGSATESKRKMSAREHLISVDPLPGLDELKAIPQRDLELTGVDSSTADDSVGCRTQGGAGLAEICVVWQIKEFAAQVKFVFAFRESESLV